MQLLGLTLAGFKSFARPTRLRFEQGLTAIIGPNGSGKSNVAEAVRWVLGEQSVKQIRLSHSQEIIFAGNVAHKQSSRAYVELILSNESDRFPVDAAEVTIGRSLTRQGESQYTVNGDPVRLLDLQHMIAQAGIGAKTYTVISQGMVDQYVNATPAARRELFDEATGIKPLQIKSARAQRTLSASQQLSHEIETVLNELEPRLRVLERQVAREGQRQTLTQEFVHLQALWLRQQWHTISHTLANQRQQAQATAQTLQAAQATRQKQEQALFTSFKSATITKTKLTLELQQEQREYEQARRTYQNAQATKERLRHELDSIQATHTEAVLTLQRLQQETLTFDWLATTRQVLHRCLAYFHQVQSVSSFDPQQVLDLEQAVRHNLDSLSDTHPVESAKALLEQIGQPMEKVAKLEAIKGERVAQLQQIIIPPVPDRERLTKLEEEITALEAAKMPSQEDFEGTLQRTRHRESALQEQLAQDQINCDQTEAILRHHEQAILREKGSDWLHEMITETESKYRTLNVSELKVAEIQDRLFRLGEPDLLAIKEHGEVSARYAYLQQQLQDIQRTIRNIETALADLRHHLQTTFVQQFAVIAESFKKYIAFFFPGGSAQLGVQEEGIEIGVTLPGKKVASLQALSGGEKTLVALSLVLAVVDAQHPPFLILDEVDAALDEANARRFAQALQEKSEHIQCIMITHNRETMSQAQILYGVTMDNHALSHVYSVRLQDIPV